MRAPTNTEASPLDTKEVSWMRADLGTVSATPNEAGPSEVGLQEVGLDGNRYMLGVDGPGYNDIGMRYRRIEPTDSGTDPLTMKEVYWSWRMQTLCDTYGHWTRKETLDRLSAHNPFRLPKSLDPT